ncbi:MAG: sugar transferase [Candidatus Nanopelagicales bacterium]
MTTDILMVCIAVGVALIAGWGAGPPLLQDHSRQYLAVAVLIVWPTVLWQRQTRVSSILGAGGEEYRRVLVASAWMVLLVATFAYFTDTTLARSFVLGVAVFGTVLLLGGRWIMRNSLQRTLNAGFPLHRVFVIASPAQLGIVRGDFEKAGNRFVEVGHATGHEPAPEPDVVVRRAQAAGADTILYLPFSDADPTWTRRLGWAMEDTEMSLIVSPSVVEIAGPRLKVEQIQGLAFLSVAMPRFSGPARVVKRTMDLVGSSVGLVFLAIPMAVIALIIKVNSRGPVLFRQERMGRDGQTFTCLKFRTMEVGADEQLEVLRGQVGQDGATFKLSRDPRVTRVGGFLRRSSLDELPQLWNVLRNDMSLVGPRPHQLGDVDRYSGDDHRRLLAKPGITGLWQVSGRSDTSWDENVMMDLYYVENWSLSFDVTILLRTVKVVFTGSGAY